MERLTNFIQLMPVTPKIKTLVCSALEGLHHDEYSPSLAFIFRGSNAQYIQFIGALVDEMCTLSADPSYPTVTMPTSDPGRPFMNTLERRTRVPHT